MRKYNTFNKVHVLLSIFALLLVIVFSLTFTLAVFSTSARIFGTITLLNDVSIIATKSYFSGDGYTGENGGTRLGYPLKQDLSHFYNSSGTDYVYGDKHGLYGKLCFESGASSLIENPDITYTISGVGNIYLAFELEIKFTPNAGQYENHSYLNNVGGWCVFPKFASTFTEKQRLIIGSGENAIDEWMYYAPNFNKNWGLVATAPFVSKTATTYSKIYRIFVVSPNEQGKSELKKITISETPLNIQLSAIISEFRYMIKEKSDNGNDTKMLISTEGVMEINMKCKGAMQAFYDYF